MLVERGSKVRLKLVGTRVDATEIVCAIHELMVNMMLTLTVCYWHDEGRLLYAFSYLFEAGC